MIAHVSASFTNRYLLVTRLKPYTAYLYHDGLARFCANQYVPLKAMEAVESQDAVPLTRTGTLDFFLRSSEDLLRFKSLRRGLKGLSTMFAEIVLYL